MTDAIHFPEKDHPLREDVRRLGALLGSVLRQQEGDELFERVERSRRAARRRRRPVAGHVDRAGWHLARCRAAFLGPAG